MLGALKGFRTWDLPILSNPEPCTDAVLPSYGDPGWVGSPSLQLSGSKNDAF